MKVLFTTNILSPYRVDFFNELGRYCDLTVVYERGNANSRNKKWVGNAAKTFIPIQLKGIRIGDAEAFCPGILRYLKDRSFEHIVIGMYSTPTAMLAIEYMKLHKIPFILNSDGGFVKNDTRIKWRIKSYFIGAASAWLSTGKITNRYLEYYNAKTTRICIYPFTSVRQADILKKPLTLYEKSVYKAKLGMSESKIILSVGQFVYRKGYDILLKSCKNLDKNIGIYIVGGDVTKEYLDLQNKLKLTNVHFVEFKNKTALIEYYMAADLFVLPTREDIWGLVINEAMAYGLPVITTDRCVAGVELIENGINGSIVISDDVDALREALEYWSNKDCFVAGKKSLQIISQYSIEKMAETHIQFFKLTSRTN